MPSLVGPPERISPRLIRADWKSVRGHSCVHSDQTGRAADAVAQRTVARISAAMTRVTSEEERLNADAMAGDWRTRIYEWMRVRRVRYVQGRLGLKRLSKGHQFLQQCDGE